MTYPIIAKMLKIFTITCLSFLGILLFIHYLSIFIPVLLVIFFTLLMEPVVTFFVEKLSFPRSLAVMTVLVLLITSLIGCFYLLIGEIYEGILYLSDILPRHMEDFGNLYTIYSQPIGRFIASIKDFFESWDFINIEQQLNQLTTTFATIVSHFLESFLGSIPGGLAHIPDSFTILIFMLLAIFLLSADFPNIKSRLRKFIPTKLTQKLTEMKQYLKGQAFSYIRAQLILMGLTFILLLIGLTLLKVNYALTIAFILFFIDLIPFIGTGIVLIPWMVYCFLTGDYPLTIGLACLYGVIIVTRQLLEPKILASHMQIHPLLWLFAAFIGYQLQGLIGLFFAPYLLVFIKGLYDIGVIHYLYDYMTNDEK